MNARLGLATFLAAIFLVTSPRLHGAEPKHPEQKQGQGALPAIGRIRMEVRQTRVLITTDVTLPVGWQKTNDVDVHVAYGAPGRPLAFDAHIMGTPSGYLVAPLNAQGIKLAHERSVRAPTGAALRLGPTVMAGRLVHIPATAWVAVRSQATVRLREVRSLPPALADGSHELVVRLGVVGTRPLLLGLVEMASGVRSADARLCGPKGYGVKIHVAMRDAAGKAGVAAPMASRGIDESLCVRFRTP